MNEKENIPDEPNEPQPHDDELSAVDKIVGVFIAPASTFKYLAGRPDFWTPLIVLSLIGIAFAMMVLPKTMPVGQAAAIEKVQEQLDKAPGTSEQDRAKTIEIVKKTSEISGYVAAIIGTPIAMGIMWVIMVAVIFFISLMQGLDTDFKRLLGVVPWASFVSFFSQGLQTWVMMSRDLTSMDQLQNMRYLKPFSLLGLFPETVELPKFVEGIFGTIDPFFIWYVILLIIAVQQANKCTRAQAAVSSLIYTALSLAAVGGLTVLGALQQVEVK